jgi:hypothetical protein
MSALGVLSEGVFSMRSAVAAVVVSAAVLVAAPAAGAAWGDHFGIAPINAPDAQTVPALPGSDGASSVPADPQGRRFGYWAGACDRGAAPPVGESIVGGVGERADTFLAPDSDAGFFRRSPVTEPSLPTHCLDWGAPSDHPSEHDSLWVPSPYDHPQQGELESACGTFAPCWRLAPLAQAGARPDGSLSMVLARSPDGAGTGTGATPGIVDGTLDNIYVNIPAGFVGDPTAVPECTQEQFGEDPLGCPPASQVGTLHLVLLATGLFGNLSGATREDLYPVFNLEPRQGNVAELGFGYASELRSTPVRIVAKARTNSDFGVTTFVGQIPAALPAVMQQITLWGVPWAASNDLWRFREGSPSPTGGSFECTRQPGTDGIHYIPPGGLSGECQVPYDPSWGPIKPFLTNPTECAPNDLTTTLMIDQYLRPGPFTQDSDPVEGHPNWKAYASQAPRVTGCQRLPFGADIAFSPTSTAADSASGLGVDLDLAQNDDPPAAVAHDPGDPGDPQAGAPGHWRSDAGLAAAQLDRAVVTLPAGMSVNPSAATGLDGCSDSEVGLRQLGNPPLFNNGDPFDKDGGADGAECPDSSKLGTVTARTPLLDEPLTGEVVLGDPKSTDPASGQMLRLFLVLRNPDRGLVAKVYGSTVADPSTGQLTTTFDKNPRVPVERFELDFEGGPRGVLALPQRCSQHPWNATFTPWTAAHNGGGQPAPDSGAFNIDANCGFGFGPALAAGMDTRQPRGHGRFSFRFWRSDGQQWLRGLTTTLPRGLLASVKGLIGPNLCSNAQANAGACPPASKIGIVDAKAGSGDPFVLEQKGEVFLTDGYKGAPYGLAVKIRPIAGPFRGQWELSPIIVRQAIHVDRATAQVTAISDPFPLIHHGVPLRTREVTVKIDRDRFMLNPSGCAAKQIDATLLSAQGTTANLTNPFQAANCARLAFKPKLKLSLTGRKQTTTGKHPGIRAVVTQQGIPEAGIKRAEVRLPKTLALDVNNAQALCEHADGTKPDLENHCPKGSIVGRARAVSPLLNRPLTGNVYFVKNIRIDPDTGNEIRTLPMIIAALRGEIAINLKGESDVKKQKLVNTFDNIPDAPVTRFNLNIKGGKNGILAITRTRRSPINLCTRGPQTAQADIDAHNRKRHDPNITMRKPCAKKTKTRCNTPKQKTTKTCKQRTQNNKR